MKKRKLILPIVILTLLFGVLSTFIVHADNNPWQVSESLKKQTMISASSITMRLDSSGASVKAAITSGNTKGKITYSIKDPSVAIVNEKGFVRPLRVGKTKLTITVAGNDVYAKAVKTINITVKPIPTAITSMASAKKGQLAIRWRSAKNIDGYQLRYGTKEDFSTCKTASIKAGKNSYTRKDVTPGATYYVSVRTYKTADGQKLYSNWSGTKKLTVLAQNPVSLVAMHNLEKYYYFRRYMSETELQQAYIEAVKIVEPLRGVSKEEQLYGIAYKLRKRYDNGMTYSMSNRHYNDPYGYLILKTASCAGCARTTGLCLNILGISYEHVNENKYSHQWARVKVGNTYWICDAYGLYCGPEPGVRKHPYLR